GLPSRPGRPGRWCALTAPFHPCLCVAGVPADAIGGLLSVALNRQVTPSWLSPAPCPVESPLSSTPPPAAAGAAATHPAHRHGECNGISLNDRRTGVPWRDPMRVIEPGATNERHAISSPTPSAHARAAFTGETCVTTMTSLSSASGSSSAHAVDTR